MAQKHVVVWGKSGTTQRLIPVDEEFYGDSPEQAKEAARNGLLVKSRSTELMPLEVMSISEEKFSSMLEGSDTPLLTFNQGRDDEFEMLQVSA